MTRKAASGAFDLAVVGAGLSGLLAAWAGVRAGMNVVQIAPVAAEPDGRTTALLADSIAYLRDLGLWDDVSDDAFALKTMRIIDATDRLIRAPQVDFVAGEIGLEAFGYNIENRKLASLLQQRLDAEDRYRHVTQALTDLQIRDEGDAEIITTSGEHFRACAVIAADGRESSVRSALNIGERKWQYPQTALVGNFTHTLPHHDISTEFHTPTGPFTLVPLGPNRSSLVWVVEPSRGESLRKADRAELNALLESRMNSILGKVSLESDLKGFPLSAMVASVFGKGPVALVGEAAHVFPPIGAQGLNLGLRDVREAVEHARSAMNADRIADFGTGYNRARRADILARTTSVDLLNRSLLSDFVPVQAIRSLGLYTLGTLAPLRRLMMREGVAPGLGFQSLGKHLRDTLRQQTPLKSENPQVR